MLIHYTCGSCHQHLLTWDDASKSVEMFHKVGIWQDFGTRVARLICEYCLGSTAPDGTYQRAKLLDVVRQ